MPAEATFKLVVDKEKFSAGLQAANEELGHIDKRLGQIKTSTMGTFGLQAMSFVRNLSSTLFSAGKNVFQSLYSTAVDNARRMDQMKEALAAQGEEAERQVPRIEKYAKALQDTRFVDDDDTIAALARLVEGGYKLKEAFQQMPLVLNVAAKWFKGDLAPATELVTRLFHGQVRAVRGLGPDFGKLEDGAKGVARAFELIDTQSKGAWDRLSDTDPMRTLSVLLGSIKDTLAEIMKPTFSKWIIGVRDAIMSINLKDLEESIGSITSNLESAGRILAAVGGPFKTISERAAKGNTVGAVLGTIALPGMIGVSIGELFNEDQKKLDEETAYVRQRLTRVRRGIAKRDAAQEESGGAVTAISPARQMQEAQARREAALKAAEQYNAREHGGADGGMSQTTNINIYSSEDMSAVEM